MQNLSDRYLAELAKAAKGAARMVETGQTAETLRRLFA